MSANAANLFFHGRCALDQLVLKALVVALAVIVRDEFGDRSAEMTFAERDEPVETLVLD